MTKKLRPWPDFPQAHLVKGDSNQTIIAFTHMDADHLGPVMSIELDHPYPVCREAFEEMWKPRLIDAFILPKDPIGIPSPVGFMETQQYGRLWSAVRQCQAPIDFPDRMVVADTEEGLCREMCRLAGLDEEREATELRSEIDFTEPGAAHHLCLRLKELTGDKFTFAMHLTPLPAPRLDPLPEEA